MIDNNIMNKVHNLDFLNNNLPDKCANLIIADPPYFEVKGEFDFIWKSFDDYLKDVEKWAIECKRILADNGTLFWYGDAKKIAYSQIILDKYFNLLNNIVWENTNSHKQQIRFSENLRTFAPITERILMYSNGETINKATIMHRDYFKSLICKIQETAKIEDFINCLIRLKIASSKESAKVLATYKLGKHKTRFDLLSKEMYDFIGGFNYSFDDLENEYKKIKNEYKKIKNEYEKTRRYFNNFHKVGDVIRLPNYETNDYEHDTVKPSELSRILITTCSGENDIVVVPFAGSGTECAMAKKENRRFIGFDIEKKYCDMSNNRIKKVKPSNIFFQMDQNNKSKDTKIDKLFT